MFAVWQTMVFQIFSLKIKQCQETQSLSTGVWISKSAPQVSGHLSGKWWRPKRVAAEVHQDSEQNEKGLPTKLGCLPVPVHEGLVCQVLSCAFMRIGWNAREREREKYYTDVWWCMQKKVIYSGNRCMQRIWYILGMLQFIPHGELGGFVQISDLLSPDHLWKKNCWGGLWKGLCIGVLAWGGDTRHSVSCCAWPMGKGCGLGSKLWTSRRTWTSASRSPAAKHTAQYCEGRVRKMFIGMWPRPVTSWFHEHTMILIALSSQPKWYIETDWNIWCTVKSSTHGSISKTLPHVLCGPGVEWGRSAACEVVHPRLG